MKQSLKDTLEYEGLPEEYEDEKFEESNKDGMPPLAPDRASAGTADKHAVSQRT